MDSIYTVIKDYEKDLKLYKYKVNDNIDVDEYLFKDDDLNEAMLKYVKNVKNIIVTNSIDSKITYSELYNSFYEIECDITEFRAAGESFPISWIIERHRRFKTLIDAMIKNDNLVYRC